jgi:hypothetical protein
VEVVQFVEHAKRVLQRILELDDNYGGDYAFFSIFFEKGL